MTEMSPLEDDLAAAKRRSEVLEALRAEVAKVIVGQEKVIEQVLVTVLSRGHALMEGVPGLAKTRLVSSLAQAAGLSFQRIQLTPDLAPSDILGAQTIHEDPQTGQRGYRFVPGPIFANMVLADDVNRTPPKTQAALLDAMQDREIRAGAASQQLPDPHLVVATQDPVEQEGTFPLSEALLDRFLLFITVDYPSGPEEWEMVRRVATGQQGQIAAVTSGAEILQFQELVARAPVSDEVLGFAWTLVRASRPNTPDSLDFVDRWVARGVGPRGTLALVTCAKARALLHGRNHATLGDVQAIARPALRHRIAGNHGARANNLTSDRLIEMLLEAIPADQAFARPVLTA
jgi:MoxR-like ATPase